jgi:hypothetical protein
MCGPCSLYVSALANQEAVRMYIPSYLYYLSGSKPRMHSWEGVWWISCSRFRHCAVHSAIRSLQFNPKAAIGPRAGGCDPVLTVG